MYVLFWSSLSGVFSFKGFLDDDDDDDEVVSCGGSVYATVAVRYRTLPTGTGFSKVLGSRLMNVGLE